MSVSFVVTVYNKAPFLAAVLAAIADERSQTGGEIIVINDGSSDGSAAILDEFGRRPDVRILHQENRGVAAATNTVIQAARHPFVRLVDGDDILVRGSTRLLQRALTESGSGYAFGNCAAYDPGASWQNFPAADADSRHVIVSDPLAEMIRMTLFVPSATLGRKAVYDQVLPLPEQYRTSQDYSLGLRVVRATQIVQLHEICCYMPSTASGRLSASKARMFQDAARISRDVLEAWPPRYRNAVVRRNSGRAYHYARRHLPGSGWRCVSLTAIKFGSYLPIGGLHRRLMSWIADTYEPAVSDPDAFP